MKKIKLILLIIVLLSTSACFNNDSMDNIKISTSSYPIQYVVNTLYGEHSKIYSIYPNDSETLNFEVTDVLLKQYSDTNLFIFNGISNESSYVKTMLNNNNKLKIIDVTSNMTFDYSMEELWLDPNNLLTIANNIKKGFEEYIKSSYLINDIEENYESLKLELTALDGKFYSTVKNASNTTIIVSDDSFKFLEKYGLEVISLDTNTTTQKDIAIATNLIKNNECNYIFIKYGQDTNETLDEIISNTNAQTLDLYTMTNLYNVNIEKDDYLTLMNQNLESLKMELYK